MRWILKFIEKSQNPQKVLKISGFRMVTQPILNSLIFTTLQNWHFLTALQIGRKFQWLPDGLCYHSEATDITKKGNFSGFLWNIPVVEEATEIDYFLWEATVFAYQKLLISVASEFIPISTTKTQHFWGLNSSLNVCNLGHCGYCEIW